MEGHAADLGRYNLAENVDINYIWNQVCKGSFYFAAAAHCCVVLEPKSSNFRSEPCNFFHFYTKLDFIPIEFC